MALEKIKKNGTSLAVFIINALLLVLAACYIRNQDEAKKNQLSTDTSNNLKPVSEELLAKQNQIASDREQKLRDLNSAPKAIEQKSTTTTTEQTVPAPSPTKTDRTTKTS